MEIYYYRSDFGPLGGFGIKADVPPADAEIISAEDFFTHVEQNYGVELARGIHGRVVELAGSEAVGKVSYQKEDPTEEDADADV